MQTFTKRKFLEQPDRRQHKTCAKLLRLLFEDLSEKSLSHYQQFLEWMELQNTPLSNPRAISDRYHWHLKLAGMHLREHNLLPAVKKGDKEEAKTPYPIALYLDNVRSAHNVGSIVRTTEAFSLGTLYFSPATPPLNHKQVQDTSMGAYALVKTAPFSSFEALPTPLIAVETCDEALSLSEFLFPQTFTLAMGNEEYGLSDKTLAHADYILQIPLRGRKNSLNVANAFAIVAAEIARQKERSHP